MRTRKTRGFTNQLQKKLCDSNTNNYQKRMPEFQKGPLENKLGFEPTTFKFRFENTTFRKD